MTSSRLAILVLLLVLGCEAQIANEGTCSNRISVCNPAADYFPTKVAFEFATSVASVTYRGTYVVVQMKWRAWSGAHEQTLVFVRCGCPAPSVRDLTGTVKTIFVPISTMLVQETVAVPKVYLIGQRAKLSAIESVQWVTTPELRDDVSNGAVLDIRGNYSRLANAMPDVLLTGSGATTSLRGWNDATMNPRRILDSNAGETHPLGPAELLKLVALMTGAEDAGNTIFSLIAARYAEAHEAATQGIRSRPVVMVGLPFAGWGWSLTRGTSYVGQFLRDAGAEYRNYADGLNDAVNGTIMTADQAHRFFASADFWVNAHYVQSDGAPFTMELMSNGNRSGTPQGDRAFFSTFQSFQCGHVLTNSRALKPGLPGNPFHELGVVRPDLILLDLVYFLHPYLRESSALFTNYTPTFYSQMPPLPQTSGLPACPGRPLPPTPAPRRAYMERSFDVEATNMFVFRDVLYPRVAQRVAAALSIKDRDTSSLGFVLRNTSVASGRAHRFTVAISVETFSCEACGNGETVVCDVALARLLEELTPTLQAVILEETGDALAVVRPNSFRGVLLCASRATSSLFDLRGYSRATPGSNEGNEMLGSGAVAGIVIGCVAFVVFAVVGMVIAFRAGHRKGYEKVLLEKNVMQVRAPDQSS